MKILKIAKIFLAVAVLVSVSGMSLFAQPRKITVSGYVTDLKNGETLLGAAVLITDESGQKVLGGCVTNSYGYYSMPLPAGENYLTFNYLGYRMETRKIDSNTNVVLNVALESDALIKEAVVTARQDAGVLSAYAGSIDVPIVQIAKAPALFGETDVLKALQMLPGVQGAGEGSAGVMVRGGGPDENLFLLDGVSLYNVEHMLGIFSVFTPEAVKKVSLYKGAFPARYGGRLSSIVDVRTNDGNLYDYNGLVSIGLLSSRFHINGPIVRGKTAFSLSGRITNTMFLEPRNWIKSEISGNYYFYDLNAKLSHRFSDRDRIFAIFYTGTDTIYVDADDSDNADISQTTEQASSASKMQVAKGNIVGTFRWNHVITPELFTNTSISYNRYKMGIDLGMTSMVQVGGSRETSKLSLGYDSGVRDIDFRSDFEYNPGGGHLVKFGTQYIYHYFRPETSTLKFAENTTTSQIDTVLSSSSGRNFYGHELALYAEDEFKVGDCLTLNPGLRLTGFYTDSKPYLSLEPRLSAKYDLDGDVALKAAYSRMSQYAHLLSSTTISLPTDLWVPITSRIAPETSDQISGGVYWSGLKGWEFSLEGYWKHSDNILEYKDGNFVLLDSTGWEDKVAMGQGRSFGGELLVQKTSGRLTGWLGYTLAKTDRYFPDGSVNNGVMFPYKYDRRHKVNIVLNYEFPRKWEISAAWTYASGTMSTVPVGQTVEMTRPGEFTFVDYIPSRNNFRLPASHRLDLGVTKTSKKRRGTAEWSMGMYNIYGAMNPNFVLSTYSVNPSPDETTYMGQVKMQYVTILRFVPYIAYTFKF